MTTGAQIKDTISSRIDRITDIPAEYRGEVIPAPKSVKIELTSKCNFGCSFCAHKLNGKEHGEMDIELYKRLVGEMRAAGVEELGLFYIGESLMCDWLPEAVEFAKQAGFPYVFLTTNGSLMTPVKADALMAAGLDSLKFSYNNANAAQFRAVTGSNARLFERIKENIRSTWNIRAKKGYKTRLYASSIKYDGRQQERMEAAVAEIRPFVDEHYWLPLFSFGGQALESEKRSNMAPIVGNPGRLDCMRPPLPCWAVFKEGHVTSDGLLAACCFAYEENKWIMADLNKVSFMEGWNSEAFQRLRAAHLRKDVRGTDCMDCIAKQG